MRRWYASKKGVSPLTVVAFLVIIALGVAFGAYLWQIAVHRAGNAILIQSVNFQVINTIIYVQNVGEEAVTVITASIDGDEFNVDSTNCAVDIHHTNVLPPRRTATITLDYTYTQKVHIQVICSDGTSYASDYTKET